MNSPVSYSIPLSILHNSFFWLIKRDSRKIFFLFNFIFQFFIFLAKKKIFTFGRHSSGERVSINGLALSLIFVMAIFFFTFVRSNAAIQKKGGNKKKKKKKKSREKRPSYVCYYDFAGGQTMMMASQTRCPELVMYLQKKNEEKWEKKKEKVLRPREIIDLARWPFGTETGCAIVLRPAWRRLPISQQTNRVTATFVCPAQNIIPAVVVEIKRKKIISFFRGGKKKNRKNRRSVRRSRQPLPPPVHGVRVHPKKKK